MVNANKSKIMRINPKTKPTNKDKQHRIRSCGQNCTPWCTCFTTMERHGGYDR